jgi:hypothetical protein
MANATEIVIDDLTMNIGDDAQTAQTLDTGTSDVVLKTDSAVDLDRVIVEVTNTAAGALVVTVDAGAQPPAWRNALGAQAGKSLAQNAVAVFGPFETGRHAQADGKVQMTFAPAATIAATFVAYRLPKGD